MCPGDCNNTVMISTQIHHFLIKSTFFFFTKQSKERRATTTKQPLQQHKFLFIGHSFPYGLNQRWTDAINIENKCYLQGNEDYTKNN